MGGARKGPILKPSDIPLLRFSVVGNTAAPELRIEWVNEGKKARLSPDFAPSPEGPGRWIPKRTPRTVTMSMRCRPAGI